MVDHSLTHNSHNSSCNCQCFTMELRDTTPSTTSQKNIMESYCDPNNLMERCPSNNNARERERDREFSCISHLHNFFQVVLAPNLLVLRNSQDMECSRAKTLPSVLDKVLGSLLQALFGVTQAMHPT
jgi:hypothetical protein